MSDELKEPNTNDSDDGTPEWAKNLLTQLTNTVAQLKNDVAGLKEKEVVNVPAAQPPKEGQASSAAEPAAEPKSEPKSERKPNRRNWLLG